MLPRVCSVIDHRWRQNVVRKKVIDGAIAECVSDRCSYNIFTSSVIYYTEKTHGNMEPKSPAFAHFTEHKNSNLT